MKLEFIDVCWNAESWATVDEQKQALLNAIENRLMLLGSFHDYPNIEACSLTRTPSTSKKLVLNCLPTFSTKLLNAKIDISNVLIDFILIYQRRRPLRTIAFSAIALANLHWHMDKKHLACMRLHWHTETRINQQGEDSQVVVPNLSSYAICIVKNPQRKVDIYKNTRISFIEQPQAIAYLSAFVAIFNRWQCQSFVGPHRPSW